MSIVDEKQALRSQIRSARRRRSAAELDELADALAGYAGAIPGTIVTAFLGLDGEPPTIKLVQALTQRVLLPLVQPDMDLEWAPFEGVDAIAETHHRLLEPTTPSLGLDGIATADLILAPALAVAADGTRLGQGGGCYDRALTRTSAPVIAVVFDEEVVDSLPRADHDQTVQGVLTPRGGLRWF